MCQRWSDFWIGVWLWAEKCACLRLRWHYIWQSDWLSQCLFVCASNGKTYSSPCAFDCAARHFNLILKCESVCDQCPTDEVSCICSDIVAPVCGSDGKTYFNECELNCAAKINSGLILRCSQECTKCPTSTCRCTNVSDPVCGSNDVTYGNSCYLGCLNDPNVSMEHQGRCNKCNWSIYLMEFKAFFRRKLQSNTIRNIKQFN